MKFVVKILVVCIIVFFSGCKDDYISLTSKTKLLTRTPWIMSSFVNHSTSLSMEVSEAVYEFHDDGTFIVFPADTLAPEYSTWEFIEKKEYLRMGNNTFKVKIISKKLFGLQYGSVDIFYVPYEE